MNAPADSSESDLSAVTRLLGRAPAGAFDVVVRRRDGSPVVIENDPWLADGTPMPTMYWLVDRALSDAVSRIEADGGVHRFESMVDAQELAAAHARHAARRDLKAVGRGSPAPSGGIGGTRVGVKCLHAHLANYLVSGDDPVGEIVATMVDLTEIATET